MAKRAGYEDREDAKGAGRTLPPEHGANASEEGFIKAVRTLTAFDAQRKALNAQISMARKQIKANGFELGQVDWTIKMASQDPQKTVDYLKRQTIYLGWLALPTGYQANMFEGMADDEAVCKSAWSRGKVTGLAGLERIVPEEITGQAITHWDRGYDGNEFVWKKSTNEKPAEPPTGGAKGGAKKKPAPEGKTKPEADPKTKDAAPSAAEADWPTDGDVAPPADGLH